MERKNRGGKRGTYVAFLTIKIGEEKGRYEKEGKEGGRKRGGEGENERRKERAWYM